MKEHNCNFWAKKINKFLNNQTASKSLSFKNFSNMDYK